MQGTYPYARALTAAAKAMLSKQLTSLRGSCCSSHLMSQRLNRSPRGIHCLLPPTPSQQSGRLTAPSALCFEHQLSVIDGRLSMEFQVPKPQTAQPWFSLQSPAQYSNAGFAAPASFVHEASICIHHTP
jgi:hypothetical protein